MFSRVNSAGIMGIDGYLVSVEADVGNGLPGFIMVGYLASEVREAKDRVLTALKNSGFVLNARKITVNLSPADIRKDGTAFDLPIAVAVLASFGIIRQDVLEKVMIAGELGLDGVIKPIHGALSMAAAAEKAGMSLCLLPKGNVLEGKAAGNINVAGVGDLKELAELLNHPDRIQVEKEAVWKEGRQEAYGMDYEEVNGQYVLKRATEVAVAGMHNILYIGPAGTGKSMMAKRIPTIMPPLSREESMEISKVHSVCGLLPEGQPLLFSRPFRSPHHTVTPQAMAGGGRNPRPGEISLATRGVLFLDELPEFSRDVLELLRQPMEDRKITVARLKGSCEFPANTMIAAAMNPCPCGFFPDRDRCSCTPGKIRKYLSRVSGPFLDRVDICVEAAPITYENMRGRQKNESSASIRKRIEAARDIQRERLSGKGIFFNSEMGKQEIEEFCPLGDEEERFLQKQFASGRISARGCNKMMKVARTIADLSGSERITLDHLYEAAGYRNMEEKYWGGKLFGM